MASEHALTPDQIDCLTHPLRLAIIQRLEGDKEATARELALRIGRPPTSLYHHLKQLLDIGLVRVVGERKGLRRPEAVYALLADEYTTIDAVKTSAGKQAYARSTSRIAEAAARALSGAVEADNARFLGAARNTRARFFMARANREKLTRINTLIDELEAMLLDGKPEDGEEIMFTFLMSPQRVKE